MQNDIAPGRSNTVSEDRRGDKEEDGDEAVKVHIITNNDEAARLIGSGGDTVTKLRREFSELKLKIGNKVPGIDEQVTEISGSISRATELLMKIAEITVEPRSTDDPMLTLLVHNAGGLIGTGGARVTEIRKKSGATIKIAKDCLGMSSQTPVTVSGRIESVQIATKLVLEFINSCEPVDVVYTPEMSLRGGGRFSRGFGGRRNGRGGNDGWGGGGGRRRRSPDRFGGGNRWDSGRGRSSDRRDGWADRSGRSLGGGWPRRDEGPRGGGWGGRSAGGWGSGPSRDTWGGRSPSNSRRGGSYDPFEPSSGAPSWSRGPPESGGWGSRPRGGWQRDEPPRQSEWPTTKANDGWAKPSERERGWGPSRSSGGWGGSSERSGRDYGGRRGRGGW